jgi:hypothetical protein
MNLESTTPETLVDNNPMKDWTKEQLIDERSKLFIKRVKLNDILKSSERTDQQNKLAVLEIGFVEETIAKVNTFLEVLQRKTDPAEATRDKRFRLALENPGETEERIEASEDGTERTPLAPPDIFGRVHGIDVEELDESSFMTTIPGREFDSNGFSDTVSPGADDIVLIEPKPIE